LRFLGFNTYFIRGISNHTFSCISKNRWLFESYNFFWI